MRSLILSEPIETARLRLREFVESDWEAILGASDSRAMEFFDEAPFTEDDARHQRKARVMPLDKELVFTKCLAADQTIV